MKQTNFSPDAYMRLKSWAAFLHEEKNEDVILGILGLSPGHSLIIAEGLQIPH